MPQAQTFSDVQPIHPAQTFTDVTPIDSGSTEPPAQPSLLHRLATDPNSIPLDSYTHATERGLANIGQGVAQTGEALIHPIDTAKSLWQAAKGYGSALAGNEEEATKIVNAAKQPFSSPLGLGDAAGRGAGQIIAGLGTDAALGAVKPLPGRALGAAAGLGKSALATTGKAATAVGESLDPDIVGLISPRAAHALRLSQKIGKVATKVAAKIPDATPAPEATAAPAEAAASPAPAAPAPAAATTEAVPAPAAEETAPMPASTEPVPPSERTLSGESALRKVLTGQDNANLLKIAKSRGINVTKEIQLKPGVADNLLINKIIDDFQPAELDEMGAKYLESTRFRHDFGDVGPEAWKTMSLQNYFPDLKLPQTVVNRTHAAILKAAANRIESATPVATPIESSGDDLTALLQESVKRAKAARQP